MPKLLYRAFGLTFRSDLALPEMETLTEAQAAVEVDVDVDITLGEIPEHFSVGMRSLTPFVQAGRDRWLLTIPDVGRYAIFGDDKILVTPIPGVDPDSLRVFLLGSSIGLILLRRGYLVLHGAALKIGAVGCLFLGQSGAGKSTVAVGARARDIPVFSDDLVAIDAAGRVQPGLNRVKLWKDTADALAIPTEGLRRIRPGLEKFSCPITLPEQPAEVRHVFALQPEPRDDLQLEPVTGMGKITLLQQNLYRKRFLSGPGHRVNLIEMGAPVLRNARFIEIRRPHNRFVLDELLSRVLQDVGAAV